MKNNNITIKSKGIGMYLQVKAISALLIYLILGFFISAPVVAESGSSSSVHKAF